MAIAIENSDLAHINCSAIGIWNKPKVDRIAKLINKIKLPPMSTGVKILELLLFIYFNMMLTAEWKAIY